MENIKFKIQLSLLLYLFVFTFSTSAKDMVKAQANDGDISDHLDLEAVTSVFGESKDLEDFEKRLNNPKTKISNLDLNKDGEVDYLRIIESADSQTHMVSIQAVIDKDQYQEVAIIVIQKNTQGEVGIQVVGNTNIYGSNYFITPLFQVQPSFINQYWTDTYNLWHSPWYWDHYPAYFKSWQPFHYQAYQTHVYTHINSRNSYHKTNTGLYNNQQLTNATHNDYFNNHPGKTFDKRNPGISNSIELNNRRNLTTDKKKKKSAIVTVNSKYPSKSNSPSTKQSSKPPKYLRAQPNSSPPSGSYSRPGTIGYTQYYSRQAPSQYSVSRTRH